MVKKWLSLEFHLVDVFVKNYMHVYLLSIKNKINFCSWKHKDGTTLQNKVPCFTTKMFKYYKNLVMNQVKGNIILNYVYLNKFISSLLLRQYFVLIRISV